MPEDLLTRLDALRRFLLNHRDANKVVGDPILRAQGQEIIDRHLDTLDDIAERLQVH